MHVLNAATPLQRQAELVRRDAAVRKTIAKFAGVAHRYGSNDCIRVSAQHLRHMGRRPRGLAKAGSYRTPKSAKRALERAGFDSVASALSAQGMIEIAPALALPGDLMLTPGTDGLDAVVIVVGNGDVFGFLEGMMDKGPQVLRLTVTPETRAWRV